MSFCVVHGELKKPTFHPWASPIGMERPKKQFCTDPKLADMKWIPVTHCADGFEKKGYYWYYSAFGCSDMFANLGPKTLIARNRCHAASLLSTDNKWWDIMTKNNFLNRALRSVPSSISDKSSYLREECIKGVFECKNNSLIVPSIYNAYYRCYLSGHDRLSYYIKSRMLYYNYSSVQLTYQPEGGGKWNPNHEILFLNDPPLLTANKEKCVKVINKAGCTSCKNGRVIENITKWRKNVLRVKS